MKSQERSQINRQTSDSTLGGSVIRSHAPGIVDALTLEPNLDPKYPIVIWDGDLTLVSSNAVVISSDSTFERSNYSGTLHRIYGLGGQRFLDGCERIKLKNTAQSGSVEISSGGDLKCEYVLHAIFDKHTKINHDMLDQTYKNSLTLASTLNMKTICFSCLGVEEFDVPLRLSVEAAIVAIEDWIDSPTNNWTFDRIVVCTRACLRRVRQSNSIRNDYNRSQAQSNSRPSNASIATKSPQFPPTKAFIPGQLTRTKTESLPTCISKTLDESLQHTYRAGGIIFYQYNDDLGRIEFLLGQERNVETWTILGGKKEHNERACETAVREFYEETGEVLGTSNRKGILRLLRQHEQCDDEYIDVGWLEFGSYVLYLISVHAVPDMEVDLASIKEKFAAFSRNSKGRYVSSSLREMKAVGWKSTTNLGQIPLSDFASKVFTNDVVCDWISEKNKSFFDRPSRERAVNSSRSHNNDDINQNLQTMTINSMVPATHTVVISPVPRDMTFADIFSALASSLPSSSPSPISGSGEVNGKAFLNFSSQDDAEFVRAILQSKKLFNQRVSAYLKSELKRNY